MGCEKFHKGAIVFIFSNTLIFVELQQIVLFAALLFSMEYLHFDSILFF